MTLVDNGNSITITKFEGYEDDLRTYVPYNKEKSEKFQKTVSAWRDEQIKKN